jgi:hypothetical protein
MVFKGERVLFATDKETLELAIRFGMTAYYDERVSINSCIFFCV